MKTRILCQGSNENHRVFLSPVAVGTVARWASLDDARAVARWVRVVVVVVVVDVMFVIVVLLAALAMLDLSGVGGAVPFAGGSGASCGVQSSGNISMNFLLFKLNSCDRAA